MTTCPACGSERSPDEGHCAACGEATGSGSEGSEPAGRDAQGALAEGVVSATAVAAPQRFSTAGPSPELRAAYRERQIARLIRWVVALGVLANLMVLPTVYVLESMVRMLNDTLFALLLGTRLATVAAEFALLSVWWMLAPVKLAPRLGYGLAAASAWHLAFTVVYWFSDVGFSGDVREFVRVTCSMPILLLAALLPLWCLRTWLHWRIEPIDEAGDESNRRPLRIVDILIATGLVAVALGLVQLPFDDPGRGTVDTYWSLSLGGLAIAIAATVTVVPFLWATLRPPPRAARLAVLTAIHVGIATLLAVLIQIEFDTPRLFVPPPWFFQCIAVTMVTVYFALLLSTLLLVRQCGYCLRWRGE